MRIPGYHQRSSLVFNMTPMSDVVFLLIIFFLVSSHLASQEVHMQLDLPAAGNSQDPLDVETPNLVVNVKADRTLVLRGITMTPQQLEPRLREAVRKDGTDLEVRIRSDQNVPYEIVEPIMLACARAGIWNVTFAVFREQGGR